MSEYSYDDMLRMQSEAKQRVFEMQKRSRHIADSFNVKRGPDRGEDEESLPRVPRAVSMPTEIHREQKRYPASYSDKTVKSQNNLRKSLYSVFGNLSEDDYEKMFILALCLLLAEENKDDSVIFALIYLLT